MATTGVEAAEVGVHLHVAFPLVIEMAVQPAMGEPAALTPILPVTVLATETVIVASLATLGAALMVIVIVAGPFLPGTVTAEGADAGPVPMAFFAFTSKVYLVPSVRPVTVQVVAEVDEQVFEPGVEVTRYFVIGEPPFELGAFQCRTADPLPERAELINGAAGAVSELAAKGVP